LPWNLDINYLFIRDNFITFLQMIDIYHDGASKKAYLHLGIILIVLIVLLIFYQMECFW